MNKGLSPDALKALRRKMRNWRKSRSRYPLEFSEQEAMEILHIHYVNLCDGFFARCQCEEAHRYGFCDYGD